MKNLKGHLTIGRRNSPEGDCITVQIADRTSGNKFVEIMLTLEDFSKVITGQAHIDGVMSVNNLATVGKIKERKELVVEIPENNYTGDRNKIALHLCETYKDEGWIVDDYFGSSGSFFSKDGKSYARTAQYRYVETK